MSEGTILNDRIEAEYNGEEITIWNHLTVTQRHYVSVGGYESHHEISVGDSPGNEPPEYITPEMDRWLRDIDVYPDAKVIDPTDDDLTLI